MGRRGKLPAEAKAALAAPNGPLPPPPGGMSPEAAEEYRRIAALPLGLAPSDQATLVAHCEAVAEVAEHTRLLRAEGPTIKGHRGSVINPRIKARHYALATLAATAQALGLTPASRVRLPAQAEPDREPDSAEAFEAEHGSGPA